MVRIQAGGRQCPIFGVFLIGLCLVVSSVCIGQQSRTWTDKSGTHSLMAVYINQDGDSVKLGKIDGKTVSVELDRLSTSDREYVKKWKELKIAYDQAVLLYDQARAKSIAMLKRTAVAGCGRSSNRLGLNAVEEGNYKDAAGYFTKATSALAEIQQFDDSARYAYVAALNNSGLASARVSSVTAAASKLARCEGLLADNPPELIHNISLIQQVYADRPKFHKPIERAVSKISASSDVRPFDPALGWIYMFEQPYGNDTPEENEEKQEKFIADKSGRLVAYASGSGFVVAPGFVLTNRHVVEMEHGTDVDQIRIHTLEDIDRKKDRPYDARLLAKDKNSDLALLQVADLPPPPVHLLADTERLAENILILGFPQTNDFGVSITTTKGSIAKLPEEANQMMYVLDARANSGNSGGPVINDRGMVVGVLQGKKIGRGDFVDMTVFNETYTLAVPSTDALTFCQNYITDLPKLTEENPRGDMAEIAERLKQSIVFIHVLLDQNKVAYLEQKSSQQQPTSSQRKIVFHWNGVRDRRCMICDGQGIMSCPNKNCSGGTVKSRITEYVPVQGGGTVMSQRMVKGVCPVCDGRNRVACSNCDRQGTDVHFLGSR